MKVCINDPFRGVSGWENLSLQIDRQWLRAEMKKTGKTAKECILQELDKIPAAIDESIRYANSINNETRRHCDNHSYFQEGCDVCTAIQKTFVSKEIE